MGPFYKEYGTYILRQYPITYIKYFVWPNLIRYYSAPPEFLEYYNGGYDTVYPIAKSWFHYSSNKVYSRIKDTKSYPLEVYSILSGVMNIVLICSFGCYLWLSGWKDTYPFFKTLLVVIVMWTLNALFTIVSSPAAIRLQAFPLLLEITFTLMLIEWLWKRSYHPTLVGGIEPTLLFKTKRELV